MTISFVHTAAISDAADLSDLQTTDSSAIALETTITRFLNDVNPTQLNTRASVSSVRDSSNAHKLAIEPGSEINQNIVNQAQFSALAQAYIQAAANNNTRLMHEYENKLPLVGVDWNEREKMYQQALIAAARTDAFGATQYILKQKHDFHVPFDKGGWQLAIEAAFVTACKTGSYNVVGFYLGKQLGDEYLVEIDLRPEVLAWGVYRSSETAASADLIAKVKAINPEVEELYQLYMSFLEHAEAGRTFIVEAVKAELGSAVPFVFREALEKAMLGGHANTAETLVSELPLPWVPALVEKAASLDQLEIADCIISYAEGLVSEASKYIKPTDDEAMLGGIDRSELEPYTLDELHKSAIRGAASTGSIKTLDEFLIRANETGRSKTAAIAAVQHGQLEVLKRVLTEVTPESTEPTLKLSPALSRNSPATGMPKSDQYLVQELMTLALQTNNIEARDFLLTEKLAVNCVQGEHIASAAMEQDLDTLRVLIDAKPSQFEISQGLIKICSTDNFKPGSKQPIYIKELFTACAVEQATERDLDQRNAINSNLQLACRYLCMTNQHQIIADLVNAQLISETMANTGLTSAVNNNSKEAFDLLLPLAKQTTVDRTLKAVSGLELNWNPNKQARRFLNDLVTHSSKDPDTLVNCAVRLATTEANEAAASVTSSPGAIAILEHSDFPTAGYQSVLKRTRFKGNQPVMDALRNKPGIEANVLDFINAVENKDFIELGRLLPTVAGTDETFLTEAVKRCLHTEETFQTGVAHIIDNAYEALNLEEVAMSVIRASDAALMRKLAGAGLNATSEHIERIVENNDEDLLAAIMNAKGASSAAQSYLDSSPGSSDQKLLSKLRLYLV